MTPERTTAVLWIAFAAFSAIVYLIGNMNDAPDYFGSFITAGIMDAVLAGTLLWRHGVSLAMPVVIAVYVFANRGLFFLLFLSVVFWSKAAP